MRQNNTGTRHKYAQIIAEKLDNSKEALRQQFIATNQINSCYIDDLLNENDVIEIYTAFPNPQQMLSLKDLREYKYVGIQIDKYNPILSEIIYAFQDPEVVKIVSEITGFQKLFPDEYLYAGGVSLMERGCFLNPHLDNSHDKDRDKYRVLNLLYYVTPDWQQGYGGNLEIWDRGLKEECRTIHSKFNRLVIMVTNKTSLHSVSKVTYPGQRCCVSNYYFSDQPAQKEEYFHVTSFRGRPEERVRDLILQGDAALRNGIRRIFKHGIKKPHYYQK
ncbi:MAG: 2OG-Fe(II) oxygenase [Cyanomargarita calcarea GSE-NOS-MK-12-04C]|jgi:Rps23 Pro-64 3,4-dihydroxylase Tpa1-like proline 4-hydroxylase|uniref:2OG-Fe(II) oxygenase n=1 Tax=Cyanomargarita calcarea GSE-NOS-MK-12-04C TaxID=2839659 RepID=A0A951UTE2_9CYAN|nr:2OG-Fe(II) oxygenase [Cyanomargarita calcarea GSE-NOS-MK-12-04C]